LIYQTSRKAYPNAISVIEAKKLQMIKLPKNILFPSNSDKGRRLKKA
jgi:hypothetical protein